MDIRESMELILSDVEHEFNARFYNNLFIHHPDVISKFDGVDLKHQGTMLVMALQVVLNNYRQPYPAMKNYLRVIGHRHFLLGINQADYRHFGTSLQTTLGAFHGSDWNSELASDWKTAFQHGIQIMLEGHVKDLDASSLGQSD